MITIPPDQVKAARTAAGLTQTEAAGVLHKKLRTWQSWEAKADSSSYRPMDANLYEMFLIKTRAARPVTSQTAR